MYTGSFMAISGTTLWINNYFLRKKNADEKVKIFYLTGSVDKT